jgi:toxin HigB-1
MMKSMIKSFGNRVTKKLFEREPGRPLPEGIHRPAFRKLRMLHRAVTLDDLKAPPGNRLELLGGDRKGQYSIRINNQWRICFFWRNGNAYSVEIVDYH